MNAYRFPPPFYLLFSLYIIAADIEDGKWNQTKGVTSISFI
jgi:hypothetical protein